MEAMHNGYVPGPDGQPIRLPAKFYWKEKKISDNPPQFKKVEYICIVQPGGDTVDRPIKEQDKYEYPRQWDAFQRQQDQSAVGWSLEQCPFLDVAQVATYKAIGIPTVEALATAPDTSLQGVMGALDHRKKAIALLKSANDAKPIMELQAKCDAQEADLKMLRDQLIEMNNEMEKLKAGKPTQSVAKTTRSGD